MTGSVEKVRDGYYRVRVYVGDGKLRSKTFQAATMREARKAANGHADAILAGRDAVIAKRGTVRELVDEWFEFQQGVDRSPTTIYRLRSITARIILELGEVQRAELTAAHCNAFYATLRRAVVRKATTDRPAKLMTESTVHHYHRVLRSILTYGEKHDRVDTVVTKRASAPEPLPYEVTLPTDAEMTHLFTTAPTSVQLAIRLDAFAGLRRGELVGLRWADLQQGVAHIRNNTVSIPGQLIDKVPKSRRPRKIPLDETTQRLMADLRVRQESYAAECGVVLARDARVLANQLDDPTGRTPIKPTWLSDTWTRHCDSNGIHVRLHDCRHWYVTQLLAAGVPISDVMEYAGHAQIATTQRYTHLAESAHATARAALDRKSSIMALPTGDVSS